jgi:hypothetical protein
MSIYTHTHDIIHTHIHTTAHTHTHNSIHTYTLKSPVNYILGDEQLYKYKYFFFTHYINSYPRYDIYLPHSLPKVSMYHQVQNVNINIYNQNKTKVKKVLIIAHLVMPGEGNLVILRLLVRALFTTAHELLRPNTPTRS